jgi:PAS domain S-box-containing protein
MKDRGKTKKQLIGELVDLRQRIAELEAAEADRKRAENAVRMLEETNPEEELLRLSSVIDNISEGITVTNLRGRITYVNKAVTKRLGYEKKELIGKNPTVFIAPKDLPRFHAQAHEIVSGKSLPKSCEYLAKHRSGEELPVTVGFSFLHDPDGKPKEILAVTTDISEPKRVREMLRIKHCAIEPSVNGIAISDLDGNLVYVNPSFLKLWGYDADEEVLGKNASEFWEIEDNAKQVIDVLRGKGAWVGELIARREDGSLFDVHLSASMIKDETGKPIRMIGSFIDISKQKRSEELLKESESNFRTIFEDATDGIYLVDLENKMGFMANKKICQMLGYSQEELGHLGVEDIHPREHLPYVLEQFRKARRREISLAENMQVRKKDGSIFYADISGTPITLAGRPYMMGIFRDVTSRKLAEEALQRSHKELEKLVRERTAELAKNNEELRIEITQLKRAEEALKKAEQEKRIILDNMSEFVVYQETNHRVLWANRAAAESLGLNPEQLIGHHCYELWHHSGEPCGDCPVRMAIETGEPHEMERSTSDGRVALARAHPVQDAKGNITGVVETLLETTEQKRTEDALRSSQKQLRQISVRMQEVEESERRRMAMELHDRVGQNLTALNINLSIMLSQLSAESRQKIASRLYDSMSLVEQTMKHIRNVLAELRPELLDDYGLVTALGWYCEGFSERTGIATEIHGEEFSPRPPRTVESMFFRVAQEALTNICKHAKASLAILTLEEVEGLLRLTIADDGRGFDLTALRRSRDRYEWGLLTMQERAKALGGQIHFESEPGGGTRVTIELRR